MDCIFCKMVTGEKPCMKVYEDEHTIVFMDIMKDADGHMVAMTKKHVNNILDCDVETLNQLMFAVKKVSNHCVDNCGYEGINLINTNGESADQCVPHFHIDWEHIYQEKMFGGITHQRILQKKVLIM